MKKEEFNLDVLIKIEKVVVFLCEKTGKPFEVMLSDFYFSNTCRAIQNPKSTMITKSFEFIADEFFKELNSRKYN